MDRAGRELKYLYSRRFISGALSRHLIQRRSTGTSMIEPSRLLRSLTILSQMEPPNCLDPQNNVARRDRKDSIRENSFRREDSAYAYQDRARINTSIARAEQLNDNRAVAMLVNFGPAEQERRCG
jgi:hypothetical protein